MSKPWREIRGNDDPARVARIDQIQAAMRDYHNSLRWRIVRAWDELRGKNKI